MKAVPGPCTANDKRRKQTQMLVSALIPLTEAVAVQARALADEVVQLVATSQAVYEETRGDLRSQDEFFGTTIKPERLLGCPVQLQSGAIYAVVVVQRFSIEPYSTTERQVLESVASRIGLQASRQHS